MTRYEEIEKYGLAAKGRKELLAHLDGKKLSSLQSIYAKCYDCTGYYADGKVDCVMPKCPHYSFMPYNPNRTKKKSNLTDEQKKAVGERLRNAVIRSSDKPLQGKSNTTNKRRRVARVKGERHGTD